MRISGVIGLLLIILGVVVLIGDRLASRRDVLPLGDLQVSGTEHQSFPPWASGLAIAAGVVLVVSGTRRRTV
jgi:drug/metabolite transporter (DMT)-like permease